MFIKARNYENCIQRIRIDIGKEVGLEEENEAYIVLKELPTLEMLMLKDATEKGEEETLKIFKKLLPAIITDHNFYEDEEGSRKMRTEDIASLIFESITLTMKVVQWYTEAAFFSHPRKKG